MTDKMTPEPGDRCATCGASSPEMIRVCLLEARHCAAKRRKETP